ncbi:MAG: DUF3987 domain-containing protein, partial [Bacteroidetes bacterium]|nr:DUF3987 domain-containing protein [Bacteroidota bacterium]
VLIPEDKKASEPSKASNQEIEDFIKQLEEKQIDITSNYAEWRDIGFALTSELKEEGRTYFHRISSLYPDYKFEESETQYDACLKSNGSGITLKTLFYHLKTAGINIGATKKEEEQPEQVNLPLISDDVFTQLPDFLKRIMNVAESKEERDILLLASIVCISAVLPNIYGMYHNKKTYPNLFLFVSAKASAGKGRLVHCRQLLQPVHFALREEAKKLKKVYDQELAHFNKSRKDNPDAVKPVPPPELMLFIPANNSATGFFQLLNDNKGEGMIFETEGDTIAGAFKSDYGNYSDGFRKAFHHETISYYRRTDREYVDIDKPCLSALLTGTPRQIFNLIPDAENGLFSRFMFYTMDIKPIWADVFDGNDNGDLDEYFRKLGLDLFELNKELKKGNKINVQLSAEQRQVFKETFGKLQQKYIRQEADEFAGTVRRMGIIAFRMMMVFSALRILETGDFSHETVCEQQDFENALKIAHVLLIHATHIFTQLPAPVNNNQSKNRKERFWQILPENFNRQDYLKVAEELNIVDKTAQAYITALIKEGKLERDKHDVYSKLASSSAKSKG